MNVIVAITTVVLAIIVLHQLAWFVVRALSKGVRRLPADLWGISAWVGAHPFLARFSSRYPRLYAFLRTRLSPRSFDGLPLTLMMGAAMYLLALLGGLVEDLLAREGVVALDSSINAFFTTYRVPELLAAFLWLTALGSGPAVTAVAFTATGFLWADNRIRLIAPLWIALVGAEVTTWTGKFVIGRARPEFLEAANAASPSFPSGHATASMAVYGYLSYAIARNLPQAWQRFEVAFWTSVLIALIGFSRIFLSLHYTSDVLSGFLVGGFWLLVAFTPAEHANQVEPAR